MANETNKTPDKVAPGSKRFKPWSGEPSLVKFSGHEDSTVSEQTPVTKINPDDIKPIMFRGKDVNIERAFEYVNSDFKRVESQVREVASNLSNVTGRFKRVEAKLTTALSRISKLERGPEQGTHRFQPKNIPTSAVPLVTNPSDNSSSAATDILAAVGGIAGLKMLKDFATKAVAGAAAGAGAAAATAEEAAGAGAAAAASRSKPSAGGKLAKAGRFLGRVGGGIGAALSVYDAYKALDDEAQRESGWSGVWENLKHPFNPDNAEPTRKLTDEEKKRLAEMKRKNGDDRGVRPTELPDITVTPEDDPDYTPKNKKSRTPDDIYLGSPQVSKITLEAQSIVFKGNLDLTNATVVGMPSAGGRPGAPTSTDQQGLHWGPWERIPGPEAPGMVPVAPMPGGLPGAPAGGGYGPSPGGSSRRRRDGGSDAGSPNPTLVSPAAAGMKPNQLPAGAVQSVMSLVGKSTSDPRQLADIRQFMRQGGQGMDPATASWCAETVGSALAQMGIKGTGSMVATSYENWGDNVDPSKGVQAGDVFVQTRGHRAGETGGHVGFLTGKSRRTRDGGLELETVSGNTSDDKGRRSSVGVHWVRSDAAGYTFRRAGKNELPQDGSSPGAPGTEVVSKPDATGSGSWQPGYRKYDENGKIIPASIRSNNPGATWNSDTTARWGSKDTEMLNDGLGQGNRIARFNDPADAVASNIETWGGKGYRGLSIRSAIKRWTGSNAGKSYYDALSKSGFDLDKDVVDDRFLDFLKSSGGTKFLQAQARQEAGRATPWTQAQWEEGQRRARLGLTPGSEGRVDVTSGDADEALKKVREASGEAPPSLAPGVKEITSPEGPSLAPAVVSTQAAALPADIGPHASAPQHVTSSGHGLHNGPHKIGSVKHDIEAAGPQPGHQGYGSQRRIDASLCNICDL